MYSTSILRRTPSHHRIQTLHRAVLVLLSSCALAACATETASAPPLPRTLRHAGEQHAPRRSRVLVGDFAPTPPARLTASPLTNQVGRALQTQLMAALAGCNCIVIVDPVDLESAPPEFRDRLIDYVVRGELIGEAKSITKLALTVDAVRGEPGIEHFEQTCALTSAAPALDDAAAETLARGICESLARRPWSTSVLDKAERMLIIGGGRSTGITLGERLSVRRHADKMYEHGIDNWIEVSGQEVAQIVVESYVGDGRKERGAQCRLVGGTIGGFDINELSVGELGDDAH